jgi:tRNA-modifying protein YgfZ
MTEAKMETSAATKPSETPLAGEHLTAGAKLADWQGCVLPESFAGFESEYRAAKESVALFDTGWRAIFSLTGRDRLKYLHAISSNDIKSLAEGSGILALLLSPQGRILAELEVYALPEQLLVLTHRSVRESALGLLRKYVIGSQVKIDDLSDAMGTVAVEGPEALDAVREAAGISLSDSLEMSIAQVTIDGVAGYVLRRSRFGAPGAEFIFPTAALAAVWQKLLAAVRDQSGALIGTQALNSLRLEAGVPWFPGDFNDGMIPHEAAVETTHINFTKGCYTGQEIVERVRSRGHVNRKRVMLKFSSTTPPAAGTKLSANGAEIGFVTSAAFSPASGTAIGMGYVRREQFAPGSALEYEGGKAEVQS